jgi:hypothetical protein
VISENIQNAIPITVLVTLILFVLKEFIESIEKYKSNKRKKEAVSLVLAYEIELNHWALRTFFRLLRRLTEVFSEYPQAKYRLQIAYDGSEHLRLKREPEETIEEGQSIPPFVNEQFKRLLPIIAELDKTLFKLLEEAYTKIADLEHFRRIVVEFLAGGDTMPEDGNREFFIPKLSQEERNYYDPLNLAYQKLTGKPLKEWKLR